MHGGNRRVLITGCGAASRAKLPCPRCVPRQTRLRSCYLCAPTTCRSVTEATRRYGFTVCSPSQCLIRFDLRFQTRHLLPSGLKKFLVNNVREVDLLLMHNKNYAAEIAHNVSSRNRLVILERYVHDISGMLYVTHRLHLRAKALGVKVTNAAGRLRSEE